MKALRVCAWIALGLFAVTCVITVMGASHDIGSGLLAWLQGLQSGWLTTTMKVITSAGEWYVFLIVCLALLLIPRTRFSYGVPLAAVTLVAAGLNTVLKLAFREPRPNTHRLIDETGFSFPSGHAMIGAAFVFMAIYLVWKNLASQTAKVIITIVLGLAILLIGVSRLYLGVHWPTDIIGGYFAAFSVFVLMLWLLELLNRWDRYQVLTAPKS